MASLMACVAVAGCSGSGSNPTPNELPVAQVTPTMAVTHAAAGLTPDERGRFYHLSEGSAIFPLGWLESIETEMTDASGAKSLRPITDLYPSWGLIPDETSPQNPYGLPVGLTVMRLGNIRWMGINCAACHVGEMSYRGARLRIDGGPNMVRPLFDVMDALQAAISETRANPRRLARFADRVSAWSKAHPDEGAAPDRSRLEDFKLLVSGVAMALNFPKLAQTVGTAAGHGRIDAFGFARNLLFPQAANVRRIDAPVSTPDIWDMEHTAWLHWGSNTNSVIERNLGQALATGVTYDAKTFDSTMDLAAAHELESLGYKLRKPEWPEAVFGVVDRQRAERGRLLFETSCASCHEKPLRTTATGLKVYQLFSPAEIGTDPAAAINFDRPVTVNGKSMPFPHAAQDVLQKIKRAYYTRNAVPDATQALWESRTLRAGREWSPRLRATLQESADYDDSRAGKVYPARPLAGIWATAPYLHNGSVPSVYDLLRPRAQRPAKFRVGQREFDPVHLGYSESAGAALPTGFTVDVSQPGNSNAGHEYGTALSDDQRFELIEYLKVLKPPS